MVYLHFNCFILDAVLGMTTCGMVKVWVLFDLEKKVGLLLFKSFLELCINWDVII